MQDLFLKVAGYCPLVGLVVSHVTVNQYLQTISLSVGIILGLVSLFNQIVKKYRK